MGQKEIMNYWLNGSDEDFSSMGHMFSTKDYHWALFVGHLVLEKLLKALFVKANNKNIAVPRTHNLVKLATEAKLPLTEQQLDMLAAFSAFNLNARYPEEIASFRKVCTRTYATEQIKEITEMRVWLKKQL